MPDFKKLIARLKRHYGAAKLPSAQEPTPRNPLRVLLRDVGLHLSGHAFIVGMASESATVGRAALAPRPLGARAVAAHAAAASKVVRAREPARRDAKLRR
jgi:hypothetical protein